MIISHAKKLIFIHVHRTAGTSFSNILKQKVNLNLETFSQHSNAMTLGDDFFDTYKDYYKFGFTRNPWERIFSWYSLMQFNNQKSLAEERTKFEKFIEFDCVSDLNSHFFHYNSVDYFTNKNGKLIADKIFRYENLSAEIRTIVNQFNIQVTEIPHVNVASPKDYKAFYTDKSRRLIAEKCRKDIEYFGYSY